MLLREVESSGDIRACLAWVLRRRGWGCRGAEVSALALGSWPSGLCGMVIHFSTPPCVHSYIVSGLRIHPGRPQIPTQVLPGSAPGGRDSSKLVRLPWDPL